MRPGRGAGFSGRPGTWPQVPLVKLPGPLADSSSQTRLRGTRRAVHGRVPEQGQLCLSPFSGRHGRCGWEPWGPRGPMAGGTGPSLTEPSPSPAGGAPAERGCSAGRPVLALEPRRAPDHCSRMSPWGSSRLGGGGPCSRCQMVFPLGCREGPLLCSHAPPHGSGQGCLRPADVDSPTQVDTTWGARVGGAHVCQVPSEGPETQGTADQQQWKFGAPQWPSSGSRAFCLDSKLLVTPFDSRQKGPPVLPPAFRNTQLRQVPGSQGPGVEVWAGLGAVPTVP